MFEMTANRLTTLEGLRRREDFILSSGRTNEEFAKTHEVLMSTAERFVAKDAMDAFWKALLTP